MSLPDALRFALFSFVLFVYAFLLCGCFTGQRQENAATVRQETRSGIEAGQPTSLTVVTREQVQTAEKSSAGVDVNAAIQAAVVAASGNVLGALDKLKPADLSPLLSRLDQVNASISAPKSPGTDWPTLITVGSAALGAVGYGVAKHRGEARQRQDADAAWDKALSYAEKLPPDNLKVGA